MATTKTTRIDGLVVSRMGPYPAAECAASVFGPDWDVLVGELRFLLAGASDAASEAFALGHVRGLLFAWGFATMAEFDAVADGAPFLAPEGEASAVAESHELESRKPGPKPQAPDAKALARVLEAMQREARKSSGH